MYKFVENARKIDIQAEIVEAIREMDPSGRQPKLFFWMKNLKLGV